MCVCMYLSCQSGLTLNFCKYQTFAFNILLGCKTFFLCDQGAALFVPSPETVTQASLRVDSITICASTGFFSVPALVEESGTWHLILEGGEWNPPGICLRRALGTCVRGLPYPHVWGPGFLVRVQCPCLFLSPEQISSLCAEEAAAQEQTGQVEECLKVNLLKIKTEMCKKVTTIKRHTYPICFPVFLLFFLLML